MTGSVRVLATGPEGAIDQVVHAGRDVLVGHVGAALGLGAGHVHIDEVCHEAATPWSAARVATGSSLTRCPAGEATEDGAPLPPCQPPSAWGVRWMLVHRAGLGAGTAQPLPPGHHVIRAEPSVASAEPTGAGSTVSAVSAVAAGPAAAVELEVTDAWVDLTAGGGGQSLTPERCRITDRESPRLIDVGLGVLSVQSADAVIASAESAGRPDRATVHRAPRSDPAPPAPDAPDQVATGAVGERPRLSWVLFLVPIPIGVLMAVLFQPYYALFTALGPLSALGRWLEGTIRWRRAVRAAADALDEQEMVGEAAAIGWESEQGQWLNRRFPGAASLHRRCVQADGRVWQIRPDQEDFLSISPGLNLNPAGHALPLGISLSQGAVVAVIGPAPAREAVVRQMLLQLATDSGPADVRFRLFLDRSTSTATAGASPWKFLSWLPHAVDVGDVDQLPSRQMAPGSVGERVSAGLRTAAMAKPVTIVLVDQARRLTSEYPGLAGAMADPPPGTGWIVLGASTRDLPASVTHVIQIDQDALVTTVATGVIRVVRPEGIGLPVAGRWARALAPLVDPLLDPTARGAPLDSVVALGQLVNTSASAIAARWSTAGRHDLRIPLGQASHEVLTVDLVAEGPHGLVAGTTGSGKSELLRSLIIGLTAEYPPDLLQFLLIDFKGGGAFDVCASLPHVSAVLTDLNAALAQRALTGLGAEVHRREVVLREAGVGDIADIPPDVTLPRLVMVVDEFATLVAELPTFVDSLVDVAQRGRSLGIHLVLATQRPSGVVDQKIRANMALRVALRVQSPTDSLDIVGSPVAADLPGECPGRAWMHGARQPLTQFQSASASHAPPPNEGVTVTPGPSIAGTGWAGSSRGELDQLFAAGTPDLSWGEDAPRPPEGIVAAVIAAAAARSALAPEPVFLPPLPTRLSPEQLARIVGRAKTASGDEVTVGVVDIPAARAQRRWTWTMGSGPLLAVGIRAEDTGGLLRAVTAGFVRSGEPSTHQLWFIDGGSADLGIGRLPHCGAVIPAADVDRVDRLLNHLESPPDNRDTRRLLLIEQMDASQAAWAAAERPDLEERVHRLITNAASMGVHVALTARSERTVPLRIASHIPNRLVFALADHQNVALFGLRPADVPMLGPGRAVDPATGNVLQIVSVPDAAMVESRDSGPAELTGAVATIPPTPSAVDPEILRPASVEPRSDTDRAGVGISLRLVVPVGLHRMSLAEESLVLNRGDHALIVGDLAAEVRDLVQQQCRRGDIAHLMVDAQTTIEQLEGAKPTTVLLVGTDQSLHPDVEKRLGELADASTHTIIASARVDEALRFGSWLHGLRRSRCGILTGNDPRASEVLRVALPRTRPPAVRASIAPGAWLAIRGITTPILLATASPGA